MEPQNLIEIPNCVSVLGAGFACRDCIVRYWDRYDFIDTTKPTNADFSYTANCKRYDCHCSCSGSYHCSRSVYDCPCKECSIDPSKQPGEWFVITRGCYKERCQCHCEGGYTCGTIEKVC